MCGKRTERHSNNWGDNPPGDSNWVYVYGGGSLKTGWFGSIDRNATVRGFDPASGAETATNHRDLQAQAAVAAVAYAIAKGDKRRGHLGHHGLRPRGAGPLILRA